MADLFGCYDEETEVLTLEGWKFFKDVSKEDNVAYLEKSTNEMKYSKPLSITRYHYTGKMYHIKSKLIDLRVTPDHKMYVAKRNTTVESRKKSAHGEFDLHTATDVFGKSVRYKRDFKWKGTPVDTILEMRPEEWLPFFGLWLAEGNVSICGTKTRIQVACDKNDVRRDEKRAICT